MVLVFLNLGYPTQHIFSFHSFTCKSHNFFFLYNKIIVHLYVYIFIIHSATEGHLGCFSFFAIVNKTSIKNDEYVTLKKGIRSFRQMPRSHKTLLYYRYFISILKFSMLISIITLLVCTFTNNLQFYLFSPSLSNFL